jgi:hypothetical protein
MSAKEAMTAWQCCRQANSLILHNKCLYNNPQNNSPARSINRDLELEHIALSRSPSRYPRKERILCGAGIPGDFGLSCAWGDSEYLCSMYGRSRPQKACTRGVLSFDGELLEKSLV